jgi:hypothetical protein
LSHKPIEVLAITAKDLVEFRELLFPVNSDGDTFSETSRQRALAECLGLDPSSVHRMESGKLGILHGVMIRRALANVADEMEIKIPHRLRYGTKTTKAKRAGAR